MRIIKSIIVVSLLFMLPACDKASELLEKPPESSLTGYLDSTINGAWTDAYGYISTQDKAIKSLTEYKSEVAHDNDVKAMIARKTVYKIIGVKKSGDSATANVEISTPDLSGFFTDLMKSALSSAFGKEKSNGVDAAAMESQVKEKIESGEFPLKTEKKEFTIIREADGWRVFLDWETQEKIVGLITEAEKLREQKKLRAAKEKYDEIFELDSDRVKAYKASKEITEEIILFEEKQAYIGNVELYDLTAAYYKTYLSDRVPGVKFKIKNKGDRTLNEVEITVYFEDSKGNVIAEEDYHPVLVSKYSYSNNKPLKPNYVWQQESGKFYQAKSVPSEWKEGAITAKVTDIEFSGTN